MQPSRIGIAAQKHKDGFNCCQSVVCTYSDLFGVDEQTAFRCAEGYGLGIAGMFLTCGSVCGMEMLAGLKNSDCNLKKPGSKLSTFALGKEMASKFEQKNFTINCKELRGTDGITDRLRSCRGCVIDCARIVEQTLFPGEFEDYTGEEY